MDFVVFGRDPWGQTVLQHLSWNIVWVSVLIAFTFLVAHAAYAVLSAFRKRSTSETDALEASHQNLPARITRHTFMARLFHWVTAATMLVLLVTAFFPILGIQFDWVTWHWIAGLVLTGAIIYHIIHTTFWLDFWSIWVGPGDIPEFRTELLRETGQEITGPKPGKYPLGNRLYHLVVLIAGLLVTITGLLMLPRIDTPILERNPYFLSEATWGFVYVIHGLVGVALVGLLMAHVFFQARPSMWWVTKSMIVGWVTRRQYLEHHEPSRWPVEPNKT